MFLAALLGAFVGAWRGQRTAWALIGGSAASAAISCFVPFDPAIWMLIDIAVIAVISTGEFGFADLLIAVLFVPSGALYFSNSQWAIDITAAIVTLQLMLTVPWPWLRDMLRNLARRLGQELGIGFSRLAYG